MPSNYWVSSIGWGREKGLYLYGQESLSDSNANNDITLNNHGTKLLFNSYSYLSLLNHPKINQASTEAIDRFGTGTHGVRLLSGTNSLHIALEKRIAEFNGKDAALTCSSGYMANLTCITSLVSKGDYIVLDMYSHASIYDAAQLSGAKIIRFRHNDIKHLEYQLSKLDKDKNILVISDAVFSMDGDIFKLPDAIAVCKKYSATLMIDEAHSIGILGSTGKGIEEYFNLPLGSIDIKVATLSKTIPSNGGYIAANDDIIENIKHIGRSFIYSAALSPPQSEAARVSFDIIEQETWRRERLQYNTEYFIQNMQALGIDTLATTTAIVPIMCGSSEVAWKMAKACQDQGLYVQAIPHPVVPKNKSRLRCCINTNHTQENLDFAIEVIGKSAKEIGIV